MTGRFSSKWHAIEKEAPREVVKPMTPKLWMGVPYSQVVLTVLEGSHSPLQSKML